MGDQVRPALGDRGRNDAAQGMPQHQGWAGNLGRHRCGHGRDRCHTPPPGFGAVPGQIQRRHVEVAQQRQQSVEGAP